MAVILFISLSSSSCHTDDTRLYTYKLINDSGTEINNEAFSPTNKFKEPATTYIGNGEEIVKHYESDPPLDPNIYSFVDFFQGDSIVVTYGDEKREIFVEETCAAGGNERNPLNICFYQDQEETFTFTEEDFQNAKPCNEACD